LGPVTQCPTSPPSDPSDPGGTGELGNWGIEGELHGQLLQNAQQRTDEHAHIHAYQTRFMSDEPSDVALSYEEAMAFLTESNPNLDLTPQGILGSKLNGKHLITALEDRTSVAAGEVNAGGALGSSDEIFARIVVPEEYWHNPGGQPSQAPVGTDLAFHQIDMMCCVDVQRRFADIDWEASLDVFLSLQ